MSSRRLLVFLGIVVLILQGCAGAPVEPPKIERISAEQLEALMPAPVAAVPLEAIVALARQGTGAEEIIERIRASASRYRLGAARIVELAREGVPLAVLEYLVAAERRQVFDDMAADANRREQACRDTLEHELRICRSQMLGPMWMPGPYPLVNCFPSPPGSPFWRCL